MADINPSTTIHGVNIAKLQVFADDRGAFMETFRKEWFPERTWHILQGNRSRSEAGVLRGLHYHHHQVDYWHVVDGRIQVALADLRPSSPTYLATEMLILDAATPSGLFIPPGVAHGFLAQTPATLTYLVDNYYTGSDELGVAWNDPTLALAWQIEQPMLSPRDRQNPFLADIAAAALPK
jgi:dTDP-4-dehydrorhamnose 3,5-epimerase